MDTRFTLRLPEETKTQAEENARKLGISLNEYVVQALDTAYNGADIRTAVAPETLRKLSNILIMENRTLKSFLQCEIEKYVSRYDA